MTGNEMLANLGLRVEDPAESVFTSTAKLDSLNLAQKTVVNMVDNAYLSELESIQSSKDPSTGTAGEITYANASVVPIRNGIVGIYDSDNNKWCTMLEISDLKKLENSYLAGSTTNPIAYVFKETIYVRPTTIDSIDIWFLVAPTALVADETECELNPALQELVLDFAEAQLWRMDAKSDRATSAYNSALNVIKTLNERYQAEKPEGIGTKGR